MRIQHEQLFHDESRLRALNRTRLPLIPQKSNAEREMQLVMMRSLVVVLSWVG